MYLLFLPLRNHGSSMFGPSQASVPWCLAVHDRLRSHGPFARHKSACEGRSSWGGTDNSGCGRRCRRLCDTCFALSSSGLRSDETQRLVQQPDTTT